MLIDSHCHLNYFEADELIQIFKRTKENGVLGLLSICTKISDFEEILNVAIQNPEVVISFGIHPNESYNYANITCEEIIKFTKNDNVVGIGETGLDYYYNYSSKEVQKKVFIEHIKAARITKLPLIIHARDADDDMIEILNEEFKKGAFKAVMHSFASSKKLYDSVIKLGFFISFSGIVTFKNAKDIQGIASIVPENKILIETDSPYLAPVPKRGKKNEPSFVIYVAQFLSKLREIENIGEITTNNFFNLFDKAKIYLKTYKSSNLCAK